MVIRKSLRKLVIFDLDGTLFQLNVDWSAIQTYKESHQQSDVITYVQQAELAGVKTGNPIEGAKKVLDTLSKNHSLAIMSRNFRATIHESLEVIDFSGDIFVIGREDVVNQKPDPEGLHKILKHFEVTEDEAIVIGDTTHDVEAAQAGRVNSIVIRNPKNTYIPEKADLYIDRLSELLETGI